MRFRVTSITDSSVGPLIRDVTVKLEDWLNAALSDVGFGGHLDQFTVLVVSVDDEVAKNERWARQNGLGQCRNPFTGESYRNLSVSVAISPSRFTYTNLKNAIGIVSLALTQKIGERPKRLPKGFEYERFTRVLTAALSAYVTA